MIKLLRQLFFLVVVRPVVLVVLGLNVRHRERLPKAGPAMLVANHNSHLDTLVLMTLFPPRLLDRLHPVAAMDYFLKNRFLAWFALNVIGIIPVVRKRETKEARSGEAATGTKQEARSGKAATGTKEEVPRSEQSRATGTKEEEARSERWRATGTKEEFDPLEGCHPVLDAGGIVIFFPEGSRGEPERRGAFRSGIYFLARRHPTAVVVPVFLHGLGKALPRGEILLVPFFVDVFVGEPLTTAPDDKEAFMAELDRRMQGLAAEGRFPSWE
jgi:1-acyl-sn-glycerol-3-phosphate acyltransferase